MGGAREGPGPRCVASKDGVVTLQGFKRRLARVLGMEPAEAARAAEPEVSVVIACRNAEGTIADALTSLQAQSHGNWEAVCVDDGSTDATREWLEVWAGTDPRIRFERIAHGGVAAARNVGIQLARSSRLLMLDADDLARPDALATILAVSKAVGDNAVVVAGFDYLDEHGIPLGESRYVPDKALVLDRLLRGNGLPPMALIPQAVLQDHWYDVSLAACVDWDLWCQLADGGARAVNVRRRLFGVRLHGRRLGRDVSQCYRAGVDVLQRWCPRRLDLDGGRDVMQRWALRCGAQALAAGDAAAIDEFVANLGAVALDEEFVTAAAGAIYDAFTEVRGAGGQTWHTQGDAWLAQIEPWLAAGPFATRAEEICERLGRRRPRPDTRVARVRRFLQQRPDVTRLVVYGLGEEGTQLLDVLRQDPCLGRRRLLVADDQADALRFLAQFLPREDVPRWRSWPHDTAVVVTTEGNRETEQQLAALGGRPGADFITVRRETPAVVAASVAAAHTGG